MKKVIFDHAYDIMSSSKTNSEQSQGLWDKLDDNEKVEFAKKAAVHMVVGAICGAVEGGLLIVKMFAASVVLFILIMIGAIIFN